MATTASPYAYKEVDAPYKDEESEPLSASTPLRSSPSTSSDNLYLAGQGYSSPAPSTPRRHWLVAVVVAAVFGIVTGAQGAEWAAKRTGERSQSALGHVADLWTEYGSARDSAVGAVAPGLDNLPLCERTLLVNWGSFEYGFGSSTTTALQAAYFAKVHNYTLLFTRHANNYGAYLDFFRPAPLDCYAPEELYQNGTTLSGEHQYLQVAAAAASGVPYSELPRVAVDITDIHPLNFWIQAIFWTDEEMQANLPMLDAFHPVPIDDQIPPFFRRWYIQFSALFTEHLSFNAKLEVRINELRQKLKLDDPNRPLTAGVHFRGGDKLGFECMPGIHLSCGNITQHCEAARLALDPSQLAAATQKPRLLLMTTEPDIPQRFKDDAYCAENFVVDEMPAGPRKEQSGQSFWQTSFNALPADVRLADAQNMLAEIDILANHVDGASAALMSNMGRMIFGRGGPPRTLDQPRLRSVDTYWYPSQFPPFRGTEANPAGCLGIGPIATCYPG
ncbi:hypothetical protein JCM6882_002244 [Rhodosporidiobolus microsporus]